MYGFYRGDELKACFEKVDVDRSGGLEFSEVCYQVQKPFKRLRELSARHLTRSVQFFALIYTWASSNPGGMANFFRSPENAKIVEQGMSRLLDAMKRYDADRSMRLSKSEVDQMFRENFPSHTANLERTMGDLFPQVSSLLPCTVAFKFSNFKYSSRRYHLIFSRSSPDRARSSPSATSFFLSTPCSARPRGAGPPLHFCSGIQVGAPVQISQKN
jgi:hypothetical protein